MRSPKCLVLIPVYKTELNEDEAFSVRHSLPNLAEFDVAWLAPEGLDLSYYTHRFGIESSHRFGPEYFESVRGYSRLLLEDFFYERFSRWEFLLICQTDAIVLKPSLSEWLAKPYDYIGAPWPQGWEYRFNLDPARFKEAPVCRCFVGNGGLSLRRVNAIRMLLREFESSCAQWKAIGNPEDLFISFAGNYSEHFVLPNVRVASLFCQELEPQFFHQLNAGQSPLGVHAWALYDRPFWESLRIWPRS